jgi:beta-mannosidase
VRRAILQARDMVNQLYNHPSIVIWCWGAQPGIMNFEKLGMALATTSAEEDPYRFIQQGNSVWPWKIAKEKYNWPIDYHLFNGWNGPEHKSTHYLLMPRDECPVLGDSVEELKYKDKRLLEFISEYGPPEALPEMDSLRKIIKEKDLWPVNWEVYGRHNLHGDILLSWIEAPKSLEQLIKDSQEYQAFFIKYHTEFYRRHKFNPCNGVSYFQFRDCWPALTASVVDYYGKKKKGYFALKQAFSPIHVMMDWPDLKGQEAGSVFCREVFVVNDYLFEYSSLMVKWEILNSRGEILEYGTITCSVPENCLREIGEVSWRIPDQKFEIYRIRFELLNAKELLSNNEYTIGISS